MRRRWRYTWGWEWLKVVAFLWFLAGIPAVVALLVADPDRRGGVAASALPWFFGAWLGPFAIVAAVLAVYGLGLGAAWVWRHPPIQRVTESVEDMREFYRGGDDGS